MRTAQNTPKGSKIRFNGVRPFWFTDMIESAQKWLVVGEYYEVESCQEASSWTGVKLVGFPQKYNLGWFS